MKGVVLEIRDGKAAVLLEDGSVVTTTRKCRVGETINLPVGKKHHTKWYRFAAPVMGAAAAALLSIGVYGYWDLNVRAASYVTMDVNPSLEYALNRRSLVVGVRALNEDAETIVDELGSSVKGSTLTEAITQTAEVLEENGYLQDDTDTVLLSVASGEEEDVSSLSDEILESSICEEDSGLTVVIHGTDLTTRDEAMESDVSTGRYVAAGYGTCTSSTTVEDGKDETQEKTETADAGETASEEESSPLSIDEAKSMTVTEITEASPRGGNALSGTEPEGSTDTEEGAAPAEDSIEESGTGMTQDQMQSQENAADGASDAQVPQTGSSEASSTGETTQSNEDAAPADAGTGTSAPAGSTAGSTAGESGAESTPAISGENAGTDVPAGSAEQALENIEGSAAQDSTENQSSAAGAASGGTTSGAAPVPGSGENAGQPSEGAPADSAGTPDAPQ